MIVVPAKDFNKSVEKIKDKIARKRLNVLVEKLETANTAMLSQWLTVLFFIGYGQAIIV